MVKSMKSVSIFTILFIIFLAISDIPEIEAQESECLKEYGGDVGFQYCAPRIFPSFCYRNCRQYKGAKGGKCISGESFADMKCLCDYCSASPGDLYNDASILIKI